MADRDYNRRVANRLVGYRLMFDADQAETSKTVEALLYRRLRDQARRHGNDFNYGAAVRDIELKDSFDVALGPREQARKAQAVMAVALGITLRSRPLTWLSNDVASHINRRLGKDRTVEAFAEVKKIKRRKNAPRRKRWTLRVWTVPKEVVDAIKSVGL